MKQTADIKKETESNTVLRRHIGAAAQDGIAFVCLAALAVYLVWLAAKGIGVVDESFYLTIPHRILAGDRMLVDEWHVSQFSAPLQLLPFRIFYAVTGSTDGIVLFFRYLYIFCQTAVSLFVYLKLRKYGFLSIIASLMYCHYTVIEVMSLSYYTMSLMACTVICLLLFTPPQPKKIVLVFTGVLFSCVVLSEPLMAFVYFLYTAVFLIRIKIKPERRTLLLRAPAFLCITAGIVISAAIFLAFLVSQASVPELIKAIPEFFTDTEYIFPLFDTANQNLFDINLIRALSKIGLLFFAADAVLFIAAAADKARLKHRCVYISVAGILSSAALITTFVKTFTSDPSTLLLRHIPLYIFGLFCWLLLEDKKRAGNLLAFWIFGAVYSFILDVSSANYVMVCLLGGVFANIAVFILSGYLFDELYAQLKAVKPGVYKKSRAEEKKKLALRICSVVLAASVLIAPVAEISSLFFEKNMLLFENYFSSSDEKTDAEITVGPLKGIYTTETDKRVYGKYIADLDCIKEETDGAVYIYDLFSWMYLYLDLPYGVYSTWYVEQDAETRQVYYWRIYPQRRPEYVYIPKYDSYGFKDNTQAAAKRLEFMKSLCECSVKESEVGYTVRVTDWKL